CVQWLDASNPPQKDELDRLAQVVRKWREVRPKSPSGQSWPAVSAVPARPPLRLALLYKRHVKTDETLLGWLEAAFVKRGYQVFVDRNLSIGVEWAKVLDRSIRDSDAVIPLISAASVQSDMLTRELLIANEEAQKRHGKPRILPVRLNFKGELP